MFIFFESTSKRRWMEFSTDGGKTLREGVLKISLKYIVLKITYKKYVWNNYFSVCAEINWSLSQFRDTAKLKVFKKSALYG